MQQHEIPNAISNPLVINVNDSRSISRSIQDLIWLINASCNCYKVLTILLDMFSMLKIYEKFIRL